MMEYTISKAKQALIDGIRAYLRKDEEGRYRMCERNRLPFYLEGAPGVGKTEIVRQVAEELGIGYVSFSITHHTRNSILGLPVIKENENVKYTEYTMSEIIAKVYEEVAKGKTEGILLLDEFSCVSETILPTMLAFLQTKNVGMHTLPEGWCIVLCGNPPQYNRNARNFDAAIWDRLRKLQIRFEPKDFLAYAESQNFHPYVISYIRSNPEELYVYKEEGNNLTLVTCRGWENLSHALYGAFELGVEPDVGFVLQFLKSERVAANFYEYLRRARQCFDETALQEILAGKNLERYAKRLSETDTVCAVRIIASMVDTLSKMAGDRKNTSRKIAEGTSNAVRLLRMSDELRGSGRVLCEQFYIRFCADEKLLEAQSRVVSPELAELAREVMLAG